MTWGADEGAGGALAGSERRPIAVTGQKVALAFVGRRR